MAFECRSLLLCDEIREEIGGKQIIIGAYSGAILIPYTPFFAQRLTIRFEINADASRYEHVECTILRPNHSIFHHSEMAYDLKYPEFPFSLYFVATAITFEQPGEHTVLLAMDSTPTSVGSFLILTPDIVPQRP